MRRGWRGRERSRGRSRADRVGCCGGLGDRRQGVIVFLDITLLEGRRANLHIARLCLQTSVRLEWQQRVGERLASSHRWRTVWTSTCCSRITWRRYPSRQLGIEQQCVTREYRRLDAVIPLLVSRLGDDANGKLSSGTRFCLSTAAEPPVTTASA